MFGPGLGFPHPPRHVDQSFFRGLTNWRYTVANERPTDIAALL